MRTFLSFAIVAICVATLPFAYGLPANAPRYIELRGTRTEGGVPGTFTQVIDLDSNENAMALQTGIVTSRSGDDGTPWVAHQGIVVRVDMPAAVKNERANAYIARAGWLRGAAPDDINVRYGAGHRATSAIIRTDIGNETVALSDWRTVNGVTYPFVQQYVDSEGEKSEVRVGALRVLTEKPDFSPPAPVNHGTITGAQPAAIPFQFTAPRDPHILVHTSVDGHDARLIFDTGAAHYFGIDAAKSWGLHVTGGVNIMGGGEASSTGGYARVGTIALGHAVLHDQTAIVAPLPWPSGVNSADGLTGFEFFVTFRTTIDYPDRVLKFESLDRPSGTSGVAVPFLSDGHDMFVTATVNGTQGLFSIDTGAADVMLYDAFARRARVTASGAPSNSGLGMGGAIRSVPAHVASFQLGPADVHDMRVNVSRTRSGIFASRSLAGNIGGSLLRCFALTIDYRARTLTFAGSPGTAACLAQLAGPKR